MIYLINYNDLTKESKRHLKIRCLNEKIDKIELKKGKKGKKAFKVIKKNL